MRRQRSTHRVLCLWLPNWALQRIRLARPALRKCELVLYEQRRNGLRVVAADRYPAGTPLAEVTTGRTAPHDPVADETALLELAAWCEQFSPTVGIERPDTLCLDVTNLEHLFGSEELLARHVLQTFARRGLTARLAIADTLGAAWALSHYGETPCIAPAGNRAIEALPIAALRVDECAGTLAELGVKRIGQLLAIPSEALACRFPPQLLQRLHQALGLLAEPIASHRSPPEIVVEKGLEYPLDDRQALRQILRELLERISETLVQRQQGALCIRCELACEERGIDFSIGLFRPSANAAHLLELATMHLERVRLAGPIDRVRLAVIAHAPLTAWQQELFEPSGRGNRRELGLLVDRLSNRLGREAVVRALPRSEAQPELAVRYEPLAGALLRKSQQRLKRLPRPLRLESKPVAIEVLAVVPHGSPIRFRYLREYHVRRFWGPERIQTGWWRGRYIQRDYYRVETQEGERFWIFRRVGGDDWFLHGAFD